MSGAVDERDEVEDQDEAQAHYVEGVVEGLVPEIHGDEGGKHVAE